MLNLHPLRIKRLHLIYCHITAAKFHFAPSPVRWTGLRRFARLDVHCCDRLTLNVGYVIFRGVSFIAGHTNIGCNIADRARVRAYSVGMQQQQKQGDGGGGATETLPPGMWFDWSLRLMPDEIMQHTEDLIARSRLVYDSVGAVSRHAVSYDSVLKPLMGVECLYSTERNYLDFPQQVSTDKAVRDMSTEADRKLQEFDVEISMRQDVFNNLLALQEKQEEYQPEVKRYLQRLIKLGRRNGLHLPQEVQEEIKTLKKHMNDLCIKFSKNLNEENTTLEFSTAELAGLPDDFIRNLALTESGKRQVTLKYPHYFPIMRKARNPETRRRLDFAFNTQCMEENTAILEELVSLRQKQAKLLGFPTHAAYVTDFLMAKKPEAVAKFLQELAEKLEPLWSQEKEEMVKLKQKECENLKIPFDGKLNYWDLRYFLTLVEEQKYAVNQEKLREYFPLPTVTRGLLDIYQELLGLTFTEVKNAPRWHPDVQMFRVADNATQALLGYFFLDLFPREGKYGHAAMFSLQPSSVLPDGTRQVAVAAMLTNFTKPTADKPSLLDHNEVVTFFHEFGHVMHQICAQSQLAHFSGTNVERDFVEAPSQMLENWCWELEPLQRMSAHYLDGSLLPADTMAALVRSRLANCGYHNLRQIVLGQFDQTIHTQSEANTREVFAANHQKLLGIAPTEGTNFSAHFGHMAGGYDAQYYGYLWSEVFSMDMFHTRFKEEGIMNPGTGLEYRQTILRPGGSLDGADMLRNFLGRDPNQDAFLVSKGLSKLAAV